jgi:cell division septum initiation protein DivIVA
MVSAEQLTKVLLEVLKSKAEAEAAALLERARAQAVQIISKAEAEAAKLRKEARAMMTAAHRARVRGNLEYLSAKQRLEDLRDSGKKPTK